MDEEKKDEGQRLSTWRRFSARLSWRGRLNNPAIPENRQPCPEAQAGFFSLLTFTWMSPIMAVSPINRLIQYDEAYINLSLDRLSTPAGSQ